MQLPSHLLRSAEHRSTSAVPGATFGVAAPTVRGSTPRTLRELHSELGQRSLARGSTVSSLLAGLAIASGLGTVIFWLALLRIPHQIERVEVHVRFLVLWWRHGILPYPPADGLPILQNPYGPVYLGLLAKLPDWGPYALGRAVSVLAILGCLAGMLWWLRRRGRGTAGSLLWIAALLPLASKPILLFAPLFRVDALALVLAASGFLIVTDRRLRRRCWARPVGLVLFWTAFATKLTMVAAPVACGLWWLANGRRRTALSFLSVFALGAGAWIVGMEIVTGGRYLASAALGNLPSAPLKSFEMVGRTLPWLFWWGACWILLRADKYRVGLRVSRGIGSVARRSPAACYLAVSLTTAAAFAANPLSSWNYLMEPSLALALLTGEAWITAGVARRRRATRYLLAHVLCGALLAVVWGHGWWQRIEDDGRRARELDRCFEWTSKRDPRVAVIGSVAAQDVLAVHGVPSYLAAPHAVAGTPGVRRRLSNALARGELDWVLEFGSAAKTADGEPCGGGRLLDPNDAR